MAEKVVTIQPKDIKDTRRDWIVNTRIVDGKKITFDHSISIKSKLVKNMIKAGGWQKSNCINTKNGERIEYITYQKRTVV